MTIIICPGIHNLALTGSFVSKLFEPISNSDYPNTVNLLIFPANGILPLSGLHILDFLHQNLKDRLESPVVFISFSAGVVGAISGACAWQLLGGHVMAFIAIDGWGVPLVGNFPIHRMSHDYFTHWSSAFFGVEDNFYADPPVDHLQMWENPQNVQGVWIRSSQKLPPQNHLSAIYFLHMLLNRYQEK